MGKPESEYPHVEAALEYAEAVVSGDIVVCGYVRQACQRQLRDLAREDWAYRFDPEAAERICRFAELLPHIKGPRAGEPLRLAPGSASC